MSAVQTCELYGVIPLPNQSAVYDYISVINGAYKPVHPYLGAVICSIGMLANVLNIIVLTRVSMRNPVNALLCAIAVADAILMLSTFILLVHFELTAFHRCVLTDFNYAWGVFVTSHAHISMVAHTFSIWTSVCLAVIRYLNIRSVALQQCSMKPVLLLIVSVLVAVIVTSMPSFMCLRLEERVVIPQYISGMLPACNASSMSNAGNLPNWSKASKSIMYYYMPGMSGGCGECVAAFWISGMLFKVLPCGFLGIFVFLLVHELSLVKERRKRLLRNAANPAGRSSATDSSVRTTKMLLTLITVFLATELPQGLVAVASAVFSIEFQQHIYKQLGDILDLLSLINSAVTFAIYCSMSRAFRLETERFLDDSRRRVSELSGYRASG